MEREAEERTSHDDDDEDDDEEDDEDEDEDDDPVMDATATDVDVEDEEKQARHIECEELNEDTMLWVDNLEGLEIGYSKNWIKQRSACSFCARFTLRYVVATRTMAALGLVNCSSM